MDYWFFINMQVMLEVIIIVLVEVSKNQCGRLFMKEFGREKQFVIYDEVIGEFIIEEL